MERKRCPWCNSDKYKTRKSNGNGTMSCRACGQPVVSVNGQWYKRREDAPEFQLLQQVRDEFGLKFPLDNQYHKYRMEMAAADIFLDRCDRDPELALLVVDEMRQDRWMRRHCQGVMWLLNDKLFWKFYSLATRKLELKQEQARRQGIRAQDMAPEDINDW